MLWDRPASPLGHAGCLHGSRGALVWCVGTRDQRFELGVGCTELPSTGCPAGAAGPLEDLESRLWLVGFERALEG